MAATTPFHIYDHAALNHSDLLECWPAWALEDQAAEVRMLQLLRQNSARTADPGRAKLFVVPVLPYVSFLAQRCHGTTHERRMARAAAALRRSPYFARNGGRDHLLVTNTFRISTFRALKPLLQNATVAWFEQPTAVRPGPNVLYRLASWRCTVVVPYQSNPFCLEQRSLRSRLRDTTVFFQGSWLAGRSVRMQFEALKQLPGAQVHEVTRDKVTRAALGAVDSAASNRSASGPDFSKMGTALAMLRSQFCLIPKGDTPSSSRFYTAIACGCVPLVIADAIRPHLPFAKTVAYNEIVTFIRERRFARSPLSVIGNTTARLRERLPAIRAALRRAEADLLYDAAGSRVADHMLAAWSAQCGATS